MPIVDVEIVLQPNESIPADLARKLADELGKVFGSTPGGTWVKVRGLSSSAYAENESSEMFYPVFVSLLKSSAPTESEMPLEVDQVTKIVAGLCNRPKQNVHLIYEPNAKGRVAFGGQVVK